MTDVNPDPPRVLGERYEVCELLAKGGMGVVYRARDLRDKCFVAIKIAFDEPMWERGSNVQRLEREASVLLSLRHRRIVRALDVGRFDKGFYLVMEELIGRTLADAIWDKEQPLNIWRAVTIADALLEALDAVHGAGFLHRDVKSENVILTLTGPKLIDFGLVKRMRSCDEEGLTEPGITVGTPRYMAPEQCRSWPLDPRADLYAVGSVLYEMLTRRYPYQETNVNQLLHRKCHYPPAPFSEVAPLLAIPQGLQDVVMQALAVDRDNRPETAREMRTALLAAAC